MPGLSLNVLLREKFSIDLKSVEDQVILYVKKP